MKSEPVGQEPCAHAISHARETRLRKHGASALQCYVNSGGPAPPCMDEGDVNDDGSVNQADVDYLQACMFGGGPRTGGV